MLEAVAMAQNQPESPARGYREAAPRKRLLPLRHRAAGLPMAQQSHSPRRSLVWEFRKSKKRGLCIAGRFVTN